MRSRLIFLLLVLLSVQPTFANPIELPDEELARESVLPVFEKTTAVLNRNVETKKRLQVGIGGGMEVNEPFYSDLTYGAMGVYHFNEIHGLNVQFQMWNEGLSSYGKQLLEEENHDASLSSQPKWAVIGNYEFVAYYGKISLTKKAVMNLNLFANAGIMFMNLDDRSTVGLNLGIGQTFFFTKHLGLRVDLKCVIYNGPNAATVDFRSNPAPTKNDFKEDVHFNNQLLAHLILVL